MMADKAHRATDLKLEQMERHLSAIYSRAEKSIYNELSVFSKQAKAETEELLKEYRETGDPEAKKQYISYFKRLTKSKEFKTMAAAIAYELYKTNTEATQRINDATAGIYAMNYNYMGNGLESDLVGYELKPVSVEDAELYGEITRQELDKQKDTAWNRQNITKSVIVGAMLMLAADKIFKRAATTTAKKNKDSATLHASGMFTDAESKGRLDSMDRASDEGYKIKKVWESTLDNRTRDSHRALDGTTAPLNEKFVTINGNSLSRPRDPEGALEEICRCRCTLKYDVGQRKGETRAARAGIVRGSYTKSGSFTGTQTVTVENMSYKEWMEWRSR